MWFGDEFCDGKVLPERRRNLHGVSGGRFVERGLDLVGFFVMG